MPNPDLLIGSYPIQDIHQKIAIDKTHDSPLQKHHRDLEPGVLLYPVGIEGYYRDMGKSCVFQGLPQKCYVICCPAASSCLGDHDTGIISVVLSRFQSFNDLSHHNYGRIAGIIIDILQPFIYGLVVYGRQHNHLISRKVEGLLQKLKMDWGHFRSQ